jgi:2-methylcitrate dehydratase PrpD
LAFAAREAPVVSKVCSWARGRISHSGPASLWLTPERTEFETAALINAVAAHALDYDDVAPAWRGHPSSVIAAALSSCALHPEAARRGILEAYAVGFELGAALGSAIIDTHYPAGWHATATIGVLAATAACCRLMAVPAGIVSHALGLAAAQAGGAQANFGTEAKSLQAGFAAAAAVRSTFLALSGIEAGASVLQGPAGFVDLYGRKDAATLPDTIETLGTMRPALIDGVELKLFPTCYATHRAMLAVLELRNAPEFSLDDVSELLVTSSRGSHDPLIARPPTNADEAKFHIETVLAMLLVDGHVRLESFSDARFEAPLIQELAAQIQVGEEASDTPGRWSRLTAVVGDRRWVREVSRLPAVSWDTGAWRAKVRDCLPQTKPAETQRFLGVAEQIVGPEYSGFLRTVLGT